LSAFLCGSRVAASDWLPKSILSPPNRRRNQLRIKWTRVNGESSQTGMAFPAVALRSSPCTCGPSIRSSKEWYCDPTRASQRPYGLLSIFSTPASGPSAVRQSRHRQRKQCCTKLSLVSSLRPLWLTGISCPSMRPRKTLSLRHLDGCTTVGFGPAVIMALPVRGAACRRPLCQSWPSLTNRRQRRLPLEYPRAIIDSSVAPPFTPA
jgi:hypothetical protein